MINILFINSKSADYLADSVLFGLLKNSYLNVWQYPVNELLYKQNKDTSVIRGNGFTLYHLLNGDSIKIADPDRDLKKSSSFDLIIFSNIQRQFNEYKKYLPYIKNKMVWIMDGEDTPAPYPYHGYYWRRPQLWFLPKAHDKFIYFKREWTPETKLYLKYKFIPKAFLKFITPPRNFEKISFSIPEEKIFQGKRQKTKLFPKHIVDSEVAKRIDGSFVNSIFDSEEAYYDDLQQSRYGITTKRAGWDCLRHYEIAANGAVICFRDLDLKPHTCAPHGLIDGVNCYSYSSYKDLMNKINNTNNEKYLNMQMESLKWVLHNSCENKTRKLIQTYFSEKSRF